MKRSMFSILVALSGFGFFLCTATYGQETDKQPFAFRVDMVADRTNVVTSVAQPVQVQWTSSITKTNGMEGAGTKPSRSSTVAVSDTLPTRPLPPGLTRLGGPRAAPVTDPAVRQDVAGDFVFVARGGEGIITKYSGRGGDVIIPSRIDGLPVTVIGRQTFRDCKTLTSVILSDSIQQIGYAAFWGCEKLTNIRLSACLKNIGPWSFDFCTALSRIEIPNSVTNIDNGAFNGCRGLTTLEIPNGVNRLGHQAFCQCHGLSGVTIPASVTSIDGDPFGSCAIFRDFRVDEENPVYSSGPDGVLFDKQKTVLVAYPSGREGAYEIPNSVTGIYGCAFMHVRGLTGITIPNSVKSIGAAAFFGSGLGQVNIPSSVTSIGSEVFTDTGIASISVDPANPVYCNDADGVLFNKAKTVLFSYPAAKEGCYEVPDGVSGIAYSAFRRCFRITSITIPSSVTNIEDCAFFQCTALKDLYFKGDAPCLGEPRKGGRLILSPRRDKDVFAGINSATVHYLSGTRGWSNEFGGLPTAEWKP